MKNFFRIIPTHIINSFSGKNIYFHIGAIFLTYWIVSSGFDWKYFLSVRNPTLNQVFFPAIVIGGLLPILLPLVLLLIKKTRYVGAALAQASLLGSLISSTYKVFTGRVQPNLVDIVHDSSRNFNFGFLEHGVFWGWPSSHTTIAFAMACTLIIMFRNNKIVVYGALLYAFYIGIGISFAIHWFSEFVAGALIGTAIGIAVGRGWRLTSGVKSI